MEGGLRNIENQEKDENQVKGSIYVSNMAIHTPLPDKDQNGGPHNIYTCSLNLLNMLRC